MFNDLIVDPLNKQAILEQQSAQLYLAMSAHCERKSFRGFAHWLWLQADEEASHAKRLMRFILDRRGRLQLKNIEAPPNEFSEIAALFDMDVLNAIDRFHLVMDAINRLPQTGGKGIYLKQKLKDKLAKHKHYINEHGEDQPEVRNWKWS